MIYMTKSFFVYAFVLYLAYFPVQINAQSATALNCGDIIAAETNPNEVFHEYRLGVTAGTTLNITVEPRGSTFNPGAVLLDSGASEFAQTNANIAGVAEVFDNLVVGSSNPLLRILGTRPQYTDYIYYSTRSDYFGAYIVSLGCVLESGDVINPGDIGQANTGSNGGNTTISAPLSFSGIGFPGLGPVDFANAFQLPLALGMPVPGTIPPSGDAVLGLTFDANAGDMFALDFARLGGNLNLGLVVLSANNEVVFQASLVTLESLSARLTLPSAGQYTIGVFRIDLLPPAAPEATAFQITGTLNP